MGKEHDSWLAGIGVEIGKDDVSGTMAVKEGGGSLTLKFEKKQDTPAAKFAIGPIPCYLKGFVKAAIEGTVEAISKGKGQITVSGSITGSVAGGVELGVGYSDPNVTVGPYGSLELSASQGVKAEYDNSKPEGQRWSFGSPLEIVVRATGKLGAKVEVKGEVSFNVEAAASSWELYIITLKDFDGQRFRSMDVREGKDMVLLKQTLAKPGPAIEAAVEKYAPESVKQAAVDTAEWVAESDTAKDIADIVGKGLDTFKEKTGLDPGARVEDVVAYLVSDDTLETSTQATQRVQAAMATLNDTSAQWFEVMGKLELERNQSLGPWRTSAEYNAVQAALEADRDLILKGQSPTGDWLKKAAALAQLAAKRRDDAENQKRAAKKQELEEQARQLIEEARRAVEQMMAVRLQAQSPGNHLNNKTAGNPAQAKARKFWETGMQKYWTPAELQRPQLDGLPPQAKRDKAYQLISLYQNAQKVFQAGVQQL